MARLWISSALLLTTLQAFAWGPEGHMIVAEIAERRLTPAAQAAVAKLLPNQRLADVSNWADKVKGTPEFSHTKPWHFVDIPDGQTYESIQHDTAGDVITAINQMIATLQNSSASLTDRQNALKFIVHFMGDIHQPLHVGRPSDRGGNSISVSFQSWTMSLHQLWDSGMITKQNMEYDQYATHLDHNLSQTADTGITVPFKDIVNENMAARPKIYDFNPIAAGPVTIGPGYMQENLALMNDRMLQGGLRLASLLNHLLQ